MLEWTDRFCRYFLRLISRNTVLYTEMVSTGALLHGDAHYHLQMNAIEHPVALQLGGSDPAALAASAKLGEQYGYDEINLNCGCPSDRVQNAMFGACMMKQANLVADCMKAIADNVQIPATVKHRIGVDEQESYQFLCDFVGTVAATGCRVFIVHARKAWLQGLSPKQNREIPPLDYPRVYQLKKDFPDLEIIINGGITSIEQSQNHLKHVDGVMVGREAYHNPYLLAAVDQVIFQSSDPVKTRATICNEMLQFIEQELSAGNKLHYMTRHMLGLFHGEPGARKFRRHLSENVYAANAGIDVLTQALSKVQGDYL